MKRLALLLVLPVLLCGCQKAEPVSATPSPIELPVPRATVNTGVSDVVEVTKEPVSGDDYFNEPESKPETVNIIIKKSERVLELYGDDEIMGRFPIRIGSNAEGHKEKEGDKRTPEGIYYICSRKDKTENTLFLGLSYPNSVDAEAAYDDGRIDKSTRNAITKAIKEKKRPPWNTPLGGAIGIHGKYDDREETQGCIAISDENIEILWEYAKMGTEVEILP